MRSAISRRDVAAGARSLGDRATCCGVEAHSALAPTGLNAVHLACDLVDVLRRRQRTLAESGARDAAFDVPYSTVHVGRIEGGVALNIVPGRATVDFEIRTIADDDPEAIYAAIRASAQAVVAPEQARFPAARIDFDVFNTYPGLDTRPGSEVVTVLRGLTGGNETIKVAFGTEGGLFNRALGTEVAICGPGSMEQGHKPDEFVSEADLAACDRMLARLVDHLAA